MSGKPFTQADFQSGIKKAVIAESVARRLYGDVDAAIGKPVLINFTDYTVCGVVENVNRFVSLHGVRFMHLILRMR